MGKPVSQKNILMWCKKFKLGVLIVPLEQKKKKKKKTLLPILEKDFNFSFHLLNHNDESSL